MEVFVIRHSDAARRVRLTATDSGPAVTAKDLLCDFSAIIYNRIEQATEVRPTWLSGSSSNGDDIANHRIRAFVIVSAQHFGEPSEVEAAV
jgi:hypothetical protein